MTIRCQGRSGRRQIGQAIRGKAGMMVEKGWVIRVIEGRGSGIEGLLRQAIGTPAKHGSSCSIGSGDSRIIRLMMMMMMMVAADG